MDGIHDLGGAAGFGPVAVEPDEPVFHEEWEGRTLAVAFAALGSGRFGTPQFRHAQERMPPALYLAQSYYERWVSAIATLLVEAGVLSADDVAGIPLAHPVRGAGVGAPGDDVVEPRFCPGDAVTVAVRAPLGHTRCPGYVRGRRGVVVRYDGPRNFDDVEAHYPSKRRDPLYAVRFQGRDLWGSDTEPATSVTVDLFESYLEPA